VGVSTLGRVRPTARSVCAMAVADVPKDDLDELLDSALDDFDVVDVPPPAAAAAPAPVAAAGGLSGIPSLPARGSKKTKAGKKIQPTTSTGSSDGPAKTSAEDEAAEGDDDEPEHQQMLDELANGLAKMMDELGDDEESQAAADQLQATIQALASGEMPNLEDPPTGENLNQEMYGKMMEQFQSMGESPEMQAMMDKMMRHILSKDILYQPMKEVGEKYPQWLTENRSSLSDEDIERYTKQQALIMELCKVYEERPESFGEVVGLMQQMQECGQPPAELIQELAPDLKFGPNGMPEMSGENGLPPELANCTIQ